MFLGLSFAQGLEWVRMPAPHLITNPRRPLSQRKARKNARRAHAAGHKLAFSRSLSTPLRGWTSRYRPHFGAKQTLKLRNLLHQNDL